jgi:hypothetical protein
MSGEKHTMRAALALSPTNKTCTTLPDRETLVVQEVEDGRYRIWVVAPKDLSVWAGMGGESEMDALPETYHVDPGERVWFSMGIAPDLKLDSQIIETAIETLAAEMMHLRTELFIIKDMLLEKVPESEQ